MCVCVTSKNWLDFVGDLVHVTLGLTLRLRYSCLGGGLRSLRIILFHAGSRLLA